MFTIIVPADEDRRARTITRLLEGRDGTLWAGTRKGLYRLDRTTRRPSLQHVEIGLRHGPELAEISDVIEDRRGRLWIATPDGLIRRWADGTTARYDKELGIPKWYLSDLFEDHRGDLWFGVRDGGFFRFTADETRAPPVLTMKIQLSRPPGSTNSSKRQTTDSGSRGSVASRSSSRTGSGGHVAELRRG